MDPSWIGRRKEKEEGYRNGTPEEKETDEVTLGAPKRRRNVGMDGKEAAKDADKGWWFVIVQVKIFTWFDQSLFGRKNASR